MMNYSTFKEYFDSAFPHEEAQITRSLLAFKNMRQWILNNYKDVFQTVQEFELDESHTRLLVFPNGTIRLVCGVGPGMSVQIFYDEREHPVEIESGKSKKAATEELKQLGKDFPLRKGSTIYNTINRWAYLWMLTPTVKEILYQRRMCIDNIKKTFSELK